MYLLVRQNLFDRTLVAKGMKTKDTRETIREFLPMITKGIASQKFRSTRKQNFLETFKNFANLKKLKFTHQ